MSEDEKDIFSISLACPCSCSCSFLFLALCNHSSVSLSYIRLLLSSFFSLLPCALFICFISWPWIISLPVCLCSFLWFPSRLCLYMSFFLFFLWSSHNHRDLLLSHPFCFLLFSSLFAVSWGSVEHVCASCLRDQGVAATEPHISSVRGCWRAHHNGSSCGSHTDRA